MRQLAAKLKPAKGFAHIVHSGLLLLLPLVIFVLVRINFFQLALVLVLLSKWRMFVVRPRYWLVNIRTGGIDIIVGISTVIFMINTTNPLWQLVWAVAYGAWLIGLKRSSSIVGISMQAFVGQLLGLSALFLEWPMAPAYALVLGSGLICYIAARHFFGGFEETYSRLLSSVWAYFAAALTWLLAHWLLFYGDVAQPIVILTVVGYGLAALYYFDHYDKLSLWIKREFIAIMIFVVAAVLILSNWGNKII